MRIIAGEFKGRRLAAVKGRIRPTSDKVREAIFNILGPKVLGARVLDLYAGTGALTLEALSRGAAEAVLVEEHPAALSVLRQNLETLAALEASGLVRPEARIVAEHSRRETLPEQVGSLGLSQARRYGDTQVAFYGIKENSQEQELSG